MHGESLSIHRAIRETVSGTVSAHLWFFYMILGLYLATPILRVYMRYAERSNLVYFSWLWCAAVVLPPVVQIVTGAEFGLEFVVATGFVGYFVVGYLLSEARLTRNQVLLSGAVVLASAAVTALATCAATRRAGTLYDGYLAPLSPNVAIMSIATFLFLKAQPFEILSSRFSGLARALTWVGSASFGVYLVHMIILRELERGTLGFQLSATTIHPALGIPVTAAVTLGLSLFVVFVLRRVPFVRAIVP